MKVVLGIGNPGKEYKDTRHNAGWMVLDRLASRAGVPIGKNAFRARTGTAFLAGERVLLVKPQTFVNLSGQTAAEVLTYYRLEPSDMLVVVDDVNLPVGQLRLRPGGGAGGHNGLKSLKATLEKDFPRLRFGVGTVPEYMDMADYVLSRFRSDEKETVDGAVEKAANAVEMWLSMDIDRAMNSVNETDESKGAKQPKDEEQE